MGLHPSSSKLIGTFVSDELLLLLSSLVLSPPPLPQNPPWVPLVACLRRGTPTSLCFSPPPLASTPSLPPSTLLPLTMNSRSPIVTGLALMLLSKLFWTSSSLNAHRFQVLGHSWETSTSPDRQPSVRTTTLTPLKLDGSIVPLMQWPCKSSLSLIAALLGRTIKKSRSSSCWIASLSPRSGLSCYPTRLFRQDQYKSRITVSFCSRPALTSPSRPFSGLITSG